MLPCSIRQPRLQEATEVERVAETTRMITCARGNVVYRAGESNEADMIGAYRETVTVALDELQTSRVVRLGRRSIEVLDRTRLETIAAG